MARGQRINVNRTGKQEENSVICDGSGNGSTPHNHTTRAAPGVSTTDQVSANPENNAGVVVTAPIGGSPVVLQGNKDTPQGEPSLNVEEVRHNELKSILVRIETDNRDNREAILALASRLNIVEDKLNSAEFDIGTNKDAISQINVVASRTNDNIKDLNRKLDKLQKCVFDKSAAPQTEDNLKHGTLMIFGLVEPKNEVPHVTLGKMFREAGIDLHVSALDHMHRIGPYSEGKKRALKVVCATKTQKTIIFSGAKKIRGIEMYSDVKFRDFLTYAEQQIYKDMSCIHMLCKKNNIKAKFDNLRLAIGTKTYTHDVIHELPDELRLERAKIVPTLDGVVYQGPHAFLSNL